MVDNPNTAEVYMKKRKKTNILHQKFTSFKYIIYESSYHAKHTKYGQRHNIPRS